MSKDIILEKIELIMKDVFDDEELVITEDTTADDVEDWDSITHIALIATVENEFGVKFTMNEIVALKNVGTLVTIIDEKVL